MKALLRFRLIWLSAFAIVVLCAAVALAALIDEDTKVEDLYNWHLHKTLVAQQATDLQDLADHFMDDQLLYLWITPPSKDFILYQPGGLIPILDMKAFPDSFIDGLAGIEENGIRKFPVWMYEAPSGDIVVESIEGKVIATIKREWGYSPDWLAREFHPALDAYENWYRDWLIESYSPQRIYMRYDLLVGEDDLIKYVWVQSIAAAQSPPGGTMKSSWSGGTVTNLKFVAIDKTNDMIELTIAWPTNGLSTNMVDFFACTNLLVQDWDIAVTTNVDLNTNCFSWVDEDSTNYTIRFYDCWTLDDGDSDGISDGREVRLYGTDEDDWDTDDDGVGDGAELLTYGTDPINTHNSLLPYSTGFESTNSYSAGTLDDQNGWESDAGATVQAGIAHAGGQAVELEALEATMTKHFATTNNSVTTELFVYLGPQFSVPTNLPATASSLVSYEAGTGIRGFDGNGSGGGSWSTASGTTNLFNQWVELKIVQNYSAETWSLYLDDTLKLSALGFKDDSVTQLGAMHVRSGIGGAVLCDDVAVSSN